MSSVQTESLQIIEEALEGENKLGQMFNEFYGKWRGFIEELDASKTSLKVLMKAMKNHSLEVDLQKKRVIDNVEKFRSEILLLAQDDNDAVYEEDENDDSENNTMEFYDDFESKNASIASLPVNYDMNGDMKQYIDSTRDTTTKQDEHASSVQKDINDDGGASMAHYYGLRSRDDKG
jgi:hypothetical protein